MVKEYMIWSDTGKVQKMKEQINAMAKEGWVVNSIRGGPASTFDCIYVMKERDIKFVQLWELHKSGVLTSEEYESRRQKLLDAI